MNSKLERKLKHLKNNLKHMRNKINELEEKEKRLEDTIYFTECEINKTFPNPEYFNLSYIVRGFSIQEVKK
jgi:predicted nuclease with TOPRIM domain